MTNEGSIRHKFKILWPYYIIQSLLAAITLFVIILILGKQRMVVASTIGATAFIVFATPKSVFAKARNVIGGTVVGLISGGIFYVTQLPFAVECSLAVGLAIFLMVALDFEHPPAAGTALAVVIREVQWDSFITILATVVVLSLCRHYLRQYLKDLV